MPPVSVREALARIMHVRPAQSASPHSYPRFDAHITIASGAASLDEMRRAVPPATARAPVPVRFRAVEAGPTFTRSVLVAVAPDAELCALERAARAGLGKSEPPPSFPHMSFAYIDDAEAGERARFIEEYEEKGIFVRKQGEEGVELDCGEGDRVDGFVGSALWIVRCEGPVEEWEVLEKIPLS
jgi:2',3'-cyclic-nucleotide 3'-phosphodiesterase